ncbi:hypothetical protein [Mesorhizobium sp. M0778]
MCSSTSIIWIGSMPGALFQEMQMRVDHARHQRRAHAVDRCDTA